MAKISTYATATPIAADLVLGTDSVSADATKNFTVQSLFGAAITLTAYDDDAAAVAGGLVPGQLYQTSGGGALTTAGIVMVVQ
jgi:hypothetical protein